MEKKSFRRQLVKYKNRVTKWNTEIIKRNKYDKEQNTTVKFIIPLFKMLGWGPLYKDMEFEYTIYNKEKGRLEHVDIALYTEDSGRPKVLVEVKPLNKPLSKGTQLLKYLRNTKISHGIYTNGQELKVIAKVGIRKGFTPSTLFHLKNLNDFYNYRKVLYVLSKESVKSGKLDKLANAFHHEYSDKWDDNDKRLKFANDFLTKKK